MSTTAHAAGFSFVEQLAEDLKEDRLDLPAFPDAVLRIQKALQSPDSSAQDIVAILGSDPALAAEVLRTANSVAFKPADKEITDLRNAVTRLGMNMVRTIAVAFAMRQLRKRDVYSDAGRGEIEAIWRESLHLAAVCHVLARRCTRLNADQALLAGLLHGLGRLYIVMRAEGSEDFTLFHPDVDIRDVASGWQAAIGKAILDKWGLPEAIQHAVEHQDDFDAELEGPESLTDVLIAAKALAAVDAELDAAACPAVRRLTAAKGSSVIEILSQHQDDVEALKSSLGG
ncbi:MAG: HDOD domain-containing protein [Gammaproteobacteria bacterium]|nr:HDOD domain-containing protein [Gammaproteobacteria bacterium]